MVLRKWLLIIQGLYYLVTGLWPIIHYESFELVSGPKTDDWLVITMAWIILVLGISFLAAAGKNDSHRMDLTGLLAALAFLGVTLYYVFNDTISPVYLLDSVAEGIIATGWIIVLIRKRKGK